ncbi:MAG: hypothetical protein IKP73_13675, partial [Bacteroidales bacterium]|nr:hypothetical protein [Bacteroidales bacterium]
MSTVFKLKAALLMACAFVVVNVSTAWADIIVVDPTTGESVNGTGTTGGANTPIVEPAKVVSTRLTTVHIKGSGAGKNDVFSAEKGGFEAKYNNKEYYRFNLIRRPVNMVASGVTADDEFIYGAEPNWWTPHVQSPFCTVEHNCTFADVPLNKGNNFFVIYGCKQSEPYQRVYDYIFIYRKEYGLTADVASGTTASSTNVTASGLDENTAYELYVGDTKVATIPANATLTTNNDFSYTFTNVPLAAGKNNVITLRVNGTVVDGLQPLSIARASVNNGPVDGFDTWEVEVCQDPDKTAAQIKSDGYEPLSLSAKAVTYGVGHWEVYPAKATGAVIVSPDSENTQLDKLPLGTTQYAWIVTNTTIDQNTNKEFACEVKAIIRVKNSFIKAEVDELFKGTCTGETDLVAINPKLHYGDGASGSWSFSHNDFNGNAPTIENPNLYETHVSNLAFNSTYVTWDVENGDNPINGIRGKCRDSKTVRIDNNSVTAEITDPKVITICKPDGLQLKATPQRDGVVYQWSLDAVTGASFDVAHFNGFETPNSPNTIVNGLNEKALYTFKFTATKSSTYTDAEGSHNFECSDDDVISIRNNAFTVDADLDDPDNHIAVCGKEYTLNPSLPAGYVGEWKIDDAASGFTLTDPEDDGATANSVVSGLGETEFSLTWNVTDSYGVCKAHDQVYLTDAKKYITKPSADIKNCGSDIVVSASDFSESTGVTQQWSTTSSKGSFTKALDKAENVFSGLGPQESASITWTVTVPNVWISRENLHGNCTSVASITVTNASYSLPAGQTITTACKDEYLFTPDYITEFNLGKYDASKYYLVDDINTFTLPTGENEPEFYCWITMESGSSDFEFEKSGEGNNATFTGKVKFSNLVNSGENRYVWHIKSRKSPYCEATQTFIIINPTPSPAIITSTGADDEGQICGDNTTLTAKEPTVGTGKWTDSNTSTIANDGSAQTAVTAMAAGRHEFKWTVSNTANGQYCENSISAIVYNNSVKAEIQGKDLRGTCNNVISLTAKNPAEYGDFVHPVTNGNQTTMQPDPTKGWWTMDNVEDAVFYSTEDGKKIITTGSSSDHQITVDLSKYLNKSTFTWHVQKGKCESTDTINVYNNYVEANAGKDVDWCFDNYQLDGNSLTAYEGAVGTWTLESKPADFTGTVTFDPNNHANRAVAKGMTTPGVYQFKWSVKKSNCPPKEASVNIDIISVTANINANTENTIVVCQGEDVTLTANNPGSNDGQWMVESATDGYKDYFKFDDDLTDATPAAAESKSNVTHLVFENTKTGVPADKVNDWSASEVTLVWMITHGDTPEGNCKAQDRVVVKNVSVPAIVNPSTITICSETDGDLTAVDVSQDNATGTWVRQQSYTGTIDPTKVNSPTSHISGVSDGAISYVDWVVKSNAGKECETKATVTVKNNRYTAQPQGKDICEPNDVELASYLPAGFNGWWKVQDGAEIEAYTIPTDEQESCTEVTEGTGANAKTYLKATATAHPTTKFKKLTNEFAYNFTWVIERDGCENPHTVVVNRLYPDAPIITEGEKIYTCEKSITLHAQPFNASGFNDQGEWALATGAGAATVNQAQKNSLACEMTNLSLGSNKFSWTITSGKSSTCFRKDEITVVSDYVQIDPEVPEQTVCFSQNPTDENGNAVTLPAGQHLLLTGTKLDGTTNETGYWTKEGDDTQLATVNTLDINITHVPMGQTAVFYWHKLRQSNDNPTPCEKVQKFTVVNRAVTAKIQMSDGDTKSCDGFITLNAEMPTGTNVEGEWTILEHPTGISDAAAMPANPKSYNTTVSNLVNGSYKYQWTVKQLKAAGSSEFYCSASDVIPVTSLKFTVNADKSRHNQNDHNVDVCGDSYMPQAQATIDLSAMQKIEWFVDNAKPAKYTFIKGDANNPITDESLTPTFDDINAIAKRIEIVVTPTANPDCPQSDYINVFDGQFASSVKLSSSIKTPICDEVPLIQVQATPDIAGMTNVVGYWDEVDPDNSKSGYFCDANGNKINVPANMTASNAPAALKASSVWYKGIVPGATVTLRWNVTKTLSDGSSCPNPKTISVTNHHFDVSAGLDNMTECGVSEYTMQGSKPDDVDGEFMFEGVWTYDGLGSGSFTDEEKTKTNAKVTGLSSASKNNFRWTVTKYPVRRDANGNPEKDANGNYVYDENAGICPISDVVTIENPTATVVSSISPANNTVTCTPDISLSATPAKANLNETGKWSIQSGNSNAKFGENNADVNKAQVYVTDLAPNDNIFVWTITRELKASDGHVRDQKCESSNSVTIWYNGIKSDIPLDELYTCDGTAKLDAVSISSYNPGADGWWTANGSISIADDQNPGQNKTIMANDEIAHTNSIEVSGIEGTVTFYWNVKKSRKFNFDYNKDGVVDDKDEASCKDNPDYITVTRKIVNAGDDKTIIVCNDAVDPDGKNTKVELSAPTLLGTGATGHWECIMAYGHTETSDIIPFNKQGGYIVSPDNATTVINGLGNPGTYQFRWVVTNGTDCQDEAVYTINNNSFKVDAYTAGTTNAMPVCGNDAVMSADSPGTLDATNGDKAEWTTLNPDLVTIPSDQKSLFNAKVTLKDNATAVLRWTVTKNGCTAYDQVTVKDESVHAYAEELVQTCYGSGNLEATTVVASNVTYGWEKVDPNSKITIAEPTNPTSAFSDMNDHSSVRVKWVVTSNNPKLPNCKSEKEVLVVNNGYTNDINAGLDASVCGADGYQLSASVTTNYEGVWVADNTGVTFGTDKASAKTYRVNETNKEFTDGSCAGDLKVYGLAVGDNTLTWYIRNVIQDNDDDAFKFQCLNKKSIVITNGDINATKTINGPQIPVCSDATMLTYAKPADKNVNIEGQWHSDKPSVKFYNYIDPTVECNDCGNVIVKGLAQGVNKFWYTVHVVGAPDDCIHKTEEFPVTNNTVNVADDEVREVCGEEVISQNDPTLKFGNEVHAWWTSSADNTMSPIDSNNPTGSPYAVKVTSNSDGLYYYWNINKGGTATANKDVNGNTIYEGPCTATQAFKVINNKISAKIVKSIRGGETESISETQRQEGISLCGDAISLEATDVTVENAHGVWTLESWPTSSIQKSDVSLGTVTNSENLINISNLTAAGSYTFRWTVTKGGGANPCEDYDEITVNVNKVVADADASREEKYYNGCLDSYTLNPTLPTGAEGWWTISSGSTGKFADAALSSTTTTSHFTEQSDAMLVVNNLGLNATRLTWSVKLGDCEDADYIDLTNNSVPATVTASPGLEVCAPEDVITLNGNKPSNLNLVCSFEKSASSVDHGSFQSNSSNTATYSGIQNGESAVITYKIVNTLSDGTKCTSSKDYTIVSNGFTAQAGEGYTVCDDEISLTGVLPTIDGAKGEWEVMQGGATFVDNAQSTLAKGKVKNLSNSMGNIFKWTVTTDKCTSSGIVTFFNNKPSNVGIEQPAKVNGQNPTICENTISLVASDFSPKSQDNIRTVVGT